MEVKRVILLRAIESLDT